MPDLADFVGDHTKALPSSALRRFICRSTTISSGSVSTFCSLLLLLLNSVQKRRFCLLWMRDLAISKAVKVYYTTINGTNDVRQKNVRMSYK